MAHTRTCAHCGKEFLRMSPGQPPKTCSADCKKEHEKARRKAYYEKNKDEILQKSKKYKEENADWFKEYYREYRVKNQDHIRAVKKEYSEENRDRILEKKREYYQKNKEHHSEYMRAYRQANPERIAEYLRKWREENPDKKRALEYSRRSRKYEVFVEEVNKPGLIDRYGRICHICNGSIPEDVTHDHPLYFNIEHIVPLIYGGTHGYENCRPSHASCNQQKNNLMEGWQNIKPRWPNGEVIIPLGEEETSAAARPHLQPRSA